MASRTDSHPPLLPVSESRRGRFEVANTGDEKIRRQRGEGKGQAEGEGQAGGSSANIFLHLRIATSCSLRHWTPDLTTGAGATSQGKLRVRYCQAMAASWPTRHLSRRRECCGALHQGTCSKDPNERKPHESSTNRNQKVRFISDTSTLSAGHDW